MNFKQLSILSAFFTFFLYAGLICSLFYFFDSNLFFETISSRRTIYSLSLSIITATVSTLLATLIAIPSAFALSRYSFRGKAIIDVILELPMIVSPVALGAMLLIFFNNPVGKWIQDHSVQYIFTIYGILLAQFITIIGISTRLIKSVIDEVPMRYEAVARSLGATPFKAFRTTTLPIAKKGIVASTILSWAKAVGEFGATITIAGSMSMKTETLPTAIYMKLGIADIEGTVVLILLLISIGLLVLYGVRLLSKSK